MRKAILLLLGLAALCLSHTIPSPTILWASYDASLYSHSSLDTININNVLNHVKQSAEAPHAADVIVLFLAPNLRSDRFDSSIEELASKAYVHAIYPYTILPNDIETHSLLADASKQVTFGNHVEIEAYIRQRTAGQRDVLVVELPQSQVEQGNIVENICGLLSNTKYIAALLADSAVNVDMRTTFQPYMFTHNKRSVVLQARGDVNHDDGVDGIYTNRWPGGVWEGIFLGLLFFFIAVTGVCCMGAVQSQERFDKPKARGQGLE